MSKTFDQVPLVYCRAADKAAWRTYFLQGNSQCLRFVTYGDSQEGSVGSLGKSWTGRLNYRAWQKYGNAPESPFVNMFNDNASTNDSWLKKLSVFNSQGSNLPDASYAPPKHDVLLWDNSQTASVYNPLLNYDNAGFTLAYCSGVPAFKYPNPITTDPTFSFSLTVANRSGSGVPRMEAYVQNSNSSSSGGSLIGAVNLSGNYNSATPGYGTETYQFHINDASKPYAMMKCRSNDASKVAIAGGRFISIIDTHGMVFDTISEGGYKAGPSPSILADHSHCGPYLKGVYPDNGRLCYLFTLGANDSGGRTAAQFKSDTQSCIDFIRTAYGTTVPFILISDMDREFLSAPQRPEWAQYAGVHQELCDSNTMVAMINSRRYLAQLGAVANGVDVNGFTVDGVHETIPAFAMKADFEFDQMMVLAGLGVGTPFSYAVRSAPRRNRGLHLRNRP